MMMMNLPWFALLTASAGASTAIEMRTLGQIQAVQIVTASRTLSAPATTEAGGKALLDEIAIRTPLEEWTSSDERTSSDDQTPLRVGPDEEIDYSVHGDNWDGTCTSGKSQSPIALNAFNVYSLSTDLASAAFKTTGIALPVEVEFSAERIMATVLEHNVWLNLTKPDNSTRYLNLAQFHFHSPSEHTYNGEHLDAEAHFVFTDPETSDIEAVASVLLTEKDDSSNLIEQLIDSQGDEMPYKATLKLHPKGLLHTLDVEKAEAVTYQGSLTTPECGEGLTWVVLRGHMDKTESKWLSILRQTAGAGNYRKVQPLHSRTVALTSVEDSAQATLLRALVLTLFFVAAV